MVKYEAVLKIKVSNMAFFINIYEKLFPPMNKYGMKLADVRQAVQDSGNLLHESFSAVNEEDLKYKMIKHNLTVLRYFDTTYTFILFTNLLTVVQRTHYFNISVKVSATFTS